jgi:ABC-2 type transport system permease protein
MNHPIWLIAAREFRTYAAATSFWVALAIGPLLMGGALLLTSSLPKAPERASLTVVAEKPGARAVFSDNFPLSEAGRREVAAVIARDGRVSGPVALGAPPKPTVDAAGISRFTLVMMLWLTLVGSLGMLLQAVVRERSNRALESLLAASRPVDIVLGKLLGVGAVSALVLAAWLGSAAGLGAAAPEAGGAVSALLRGFADPVGLARAALVYVFGFAFYGLATVAVGAMARDNADAQNLARPMFAVLLVAFFTSMAMVQGGGGLNWLVYAPPFTPFVLLMSPQLPAGVEAAAFGLLVASTVAAGWWAVRVLGVERTVIERRKRRRRPASAAAAHP